MNYVGDEAARMARAIEARFQALPASAGVIFVAVTASPTPDGVPTSLEVVLGLSRTLSESVGRVLADRVLAPEIEWKKLSITVKVYCGVAGASHDQGDDRTRPDPS